MSAPYWIDILNPTVLNSTHKKRNARKVGTGGQRGYLQNMYISHNTTIDKNYNNLNEIISAAFGSRAKDNSRTSKLLDQLILVSEEEE